MNIGNVFYEKAHQYEQMPAFTFEKKVYTYKDVAVLVQQWREYLDGKITAGDRVLCFSDNCPEVMAVYIAVAGLGCVFVPINPQLTEEEVDDIIDRAAPALAIVSSIEVLNIQHIPEIIGIKRFTVDAKASLPTVPFVEGTGDEGCLICFTSGSTGRAKGVYISHRNEITSCEQYAKNWQITEADRVLLTLPQSFLYGLTTGCLTALLAGAHVILERRFHPGEALTRIEEQQVTVFMGVPTMYTMMLDVQRKAEHTYKTQSLRLLLTAGAPIATEVLEEFEATFHISLSNFYALSEIRPIFTHQGVSIQQKPKSCGTYVDEVEACLIDAEGNIITTPHTEGEIIARSETLMLEYYGDPEVTAQTIKDGWFYTGDLAVFDEDGYFYITGRKKELVIRGGINISPVEVESFIYNHEAVLEVVVVGVPDKIFGEELFAQIVIKEGYLLQEQELRQLLTDKLASYKVPKYIEFVQELPKNHSGKINKKQVKAQWEQYALQQHN